MATVPTSLEEIIKQFGPSLNFPNPEGIPAGIRADIRVERPEPSLLAQTE